MRARIARHALLRLWAVAVIGILVGVSSGCGPEPPRAFIAESETVLQLSAIGCSGIVKVEVKDPATGEYYEGMTTLWEGSADKDAEQRSITLFESNVGYTGLPAPVPTQRVLIGFYVRGSNPGGQLAGVLSAIPGGQALTVDGLVDRASVVVESCPESPN